MADQQGVDALLETSYSLLATLDLDAAQAKLEEGLSLDFEHPELLCALKHARWWQDSAKRVEARPDPLEAGDLCMARLRAFQDFAGRICDPVERPALAFKHFACGLALSRYRQMELPGETPDPELAIRLGRALKGLGDYEAAVATFEKAAKLRKDDAALLSELADCYGLVGEARMSKALFREAFFINPQRVDLAGVESESVRRLAAKAMEHAQGEHEAAEWIPVHGELLAVFSVKRELKPMEISRIKQSIYEMETELASDGSRRAVLLPRLINRYFWLADCYMSRREPKERIDELLLKIKLLDPNVYKLYIA